MKQIPYRRPKLDKDYFVVDNVLDNIEEVRERCLKRGDWTQGYPYRNETWPGMRCQNGLTGDEIKIVEDVVKKKTGSRELWQANVPGEGALSHNFVQLVGASESGPRPHTDSKKLCRYAAVLYLTPDAPADAGTSFYRIRYPDGSLGGNCCPPPYFNLRDALGLRALPIEAWQQEMSVDNVFNRLLLYRGDLVHSASKYFGSSMQEKRMTIVFFWMAK